MECRADSLTSLSRLHCSAGSRLYASARGAFPKDVYGPHLKSLHLYLYVRDRRAEGRETWAEIMEAWNEMAEDMGLRNTYTRVNNFRRDYNRVKRALDRNALVNPRNPTGARP